MSTMTVALHISEVTPNSPKFREALDKAGKILAGTPLSVYSRHSHYHVADGEVLFEECIFPGELEMRPVPRDEAIGRGLPSCWGVAPDGTSVVLRYADVITHRATSIDVNSQEFQAQLARACADFAAAGLHSILEINVAPHLFPAGLGHVTNEETDEATRTQKVTRIATPAAITNGDWALAACWSFGGDGTPYVHGMCSGVSGSQRH